MAWRFGIVELSPRSWWERYDIANRKWYNIN